MFQVSPDDPRALRHRPFPPGTRLRSLEDRVNGEAEARSHLAGQFHEAIAELVEFAVDAHVAITISEANIDVLTKNLGRLTDLMEQHVRYADERMDAISTALQAVYDVTKPGPSRWSRTRMEMRTLFGR